MKRLYSLLLALGLLFLLSLTAAGADRGGVTILSLIHISEPTRPY